MNILIFMIINHCFNNMKIIYLEKIYVNNVVLLTDIKIYKKIFNSVFIIRSDVKYLPKIKS